MIGVLITIFSFAAAGFWFWSAATPFPKKDISMGANQDKFRKQGYLNALGAACAGVAAILQGIGYLGH